MSKCRNFRGELVDAPCDLPTIVASYGGSVIVWSRMHKTHQVRYGLQVHHFNDSIDAAQDFGCCVHHYAECYGLLDCG